jgi:peptide/nickel transport system substrate-binding protein
VATDRPTGAPPRALGLTGRPGLAALLSLAAGCHQPPPPDALEIAVAAGPSTLDPRFATDATGVRISRLIHAGLVRLDASTLAPIPYAAETLTQEDSTHLRVTLRPGLHFGSGAPFEAADVCATLEALGSPALGSPHRPVVAAIARCQIDGPLALRIELREPRATLLTDLEVPILRRDQAASAPSSWVDGLGPYRLASQEGESCRLEAREGSPLPRPAHDLVVRVIHDENARATRLLAGRADIVPNAISPTLLPALEANGVRVNSRAGATLTYLLAQNERPGLSDKRAREGLGRALDRPLLARALLGPHARVAGSLLPPESWAYAPPPRPLAFDPEQARQLLAAAGLRRVTLLCSTDRQRVTMARAVAQMLSDAGLEVELIPLELGVLLHRLSAGDFELAILQIPEMTEPNVLRWFFHSGSIPSAGRAGANRARYASPAVDGWLDAAARETDRPTRRALYHQVLDRMLDDLPVIPLFHEAQIAAVSARAASFAPSSEGRWLDVATLP